jgi:hypothetical protein
LASEGSNEPKNFARNGRFHGKGDHTGRGDKFPDRKGIARDSASICQPFVTPSIRPSKSEYGQMRLRVAGGAMISVLFSATREF